MSDKLVPVCEKLDYYLKLHPLIDVPTGTKSTTPPSKFSQHLDDSLILKRIVYDPELVPNLLAVVDKKIACFDNDTMLTLKLPLTQKRLRQKVLNKEANCVEYHDKTLAPLHGIIATALCKGRFEASTGALEQKNENMFVWTARDLVKTQGLGNIPDGVLQLEDSCHSSAQPLLKHLKEIAAWEFKRPQVIDEGLRKIMQDLIAKREFSWCRCTVVNADNTNHADKCTAKQHLTSDGSYRFYIRPRGPDVFSPAVDEDASESKSAESVAGSAPLRPNISATSVDKAHNIFQQVWTNGVIGDFTFTILTSVEFELICWRHRESQTLYVSDVIETSKSENHTKIMAGLYLSALDDAMKRDCLLDDALTANSKQYQGCTEEQRNMFETILRHWKVPDHRPSSFTYTIEKDQAEAAKKLFECESIYLVAPIPEKEGVSQIFLPELPHLWLRVDTPIDSILPKNDELGPLGVDDFDIDLADEIQDVTAKQSEEYEAKTLSDDDVGPFGEGGQGRSNVHNLFCEVVGEQSPPYAGELLNENELEQFPSSQPTDYLPEHQDSASDSKGEITFDPAETWAMPPPDSIEVYAMRDIAHQKFGGRVRFNNRYLLEDKVEIKIHRVDYRKWRSLRDGLEEIQRHYDILELTQARTEFRVYGVFMYNHAMKSDDRSQARNYQLAKFSKKSRTKVPARYFAVLTSPTGRSLGEVHEALNENQIRELLEPLVKSHKEGYLHGKIRQEHLRLLADGRGCVIGWADPKKYDLTDPIFLRCSMREVQKLKVYLEGREKTILEGGSMQNNATSTTSSSSKPEKRKAEGRISLDREHKKTILDGEPSEDSE